MLRKPSWNSWEWKRVGSSLSVSVVWAGGGGSWRCCESGVGSGDAGRSWLRKKKQHWLRMVVVWHPCPTLSSCRRSSTGVSQALRKSLHCCSCCSRCCRSCNCCSYRSLNCRRTSEHWRSRSSWSNHWWWNLWQAGRSWGWSWKERLDLKVGLWKAACFHLQRYYWGFRIYSCLPGLLQGWWVVGGTECWWKQVSQKEAFWWRMEVGYLLSPLSSL